MTIMIHVYIFFTSIKNLLTIKLLFFSLIDEFVCDEPMEKKAGPICFKVYLNTFI